MLSSLHNLLFDSADSPLAKLRLKIYKANRAQIGEHAQDVARSLETAIEVIAALNSCARNRQTPPERLEGEATGSVETLRQFVLALDDVYDFVLRLEEKSTAKH